MAEFDKKFLVVDDDPVSRMILRILSERGYRVVAAKDVSGVDSAKGVRIAERIRTLVSLDPFPLDHGPLKVTVSIGVATFHPGDYNGVDYAVDALLKRADAALYWAKEEGRNRVVLFEGGRDEGADSRG